MHFDLHILRTTPKGVECATSVSTGWTVWLPRGGGVTWTGELEPGGSAVASVPDWLCAKHKQLQQIRFQRAFAYQAPDAGLDPTKGKGGIPMTDRPADAGKGSIR